MLMLGARNWFFQLIPSKCQLPAQTSWAHDPQILALPGSPLRLGPCAAVEVPHRPAARWPRYRRRRFPKRRRSRRPRRAVDRRPPSQPHSSAASRDGKRTLETRGCRPPRRRPRSRPKPLARSACSRRPPRASSDRSRRRRPSGTSQKACSPSRRSRDHLAPGPRSSRTRWRPGRGHRSRKCRSSAGLGCRPARRHWGRTPKSVQRRARPRRRLEAPSSGCRPSVEPVSGC